MDLYKIFVDYGVPKEHLDLMKEELIERNRYQYYYDEIDSTQIEEVEVSKICSVSRHQGDSWFDTMSKVLNGEDNSINLNSERFINLLKLMGENNLEEIRSLFNSKGMGSNIYFDYYLEDDKYVQHTDGNHRTILAKILKVEKIKPYQIVKHKRNDPKYQQYILTEEIYNEIKQFAKLNNMSVYGDYHDSIFEVKDEQSNLSFEFNGLCILESVESREDKVQLNEALFKDLITTVEAKQNFEKIFKRMPLLPLRVFGGLIVKVLSNKHTQRGARTALQIWEDVKIEEYINKKRMG